MNQEGFDRKAFLTHYAKNIIQPSSANLLNKSATLQATIATFIETQNQNHLDQAQAAWEDTFEAWTKVNAFNFGPGGTSGLRRTLAEEVSSWPVNVEAIEEKIASDAPSFDDGKRNTRGLLGIEYLLYGESDETVLKNFNEKRGSYLQQTVDMLVRQLQTFNSAWQGSFAEEFIEADGTSVKSSTAQMYNEFIRSYESIKDLKLGIPLGVIAGQTTAQPEFVEARFSKNSLDYALSHYQALVDLWYGKASDGTDGVGWQEYILSAEGGAALANSTIEQFNTIQTIINQLPKDTDLQTLATDRNPQIIALQNELQNLTRLLKSDLSSLLTLAITFSSMDGD